MQRWSMSVTCVMLNLSTALLLICCFGKEVSVATDLCYDTQVTG